VESEISCLLAKIALMNFSIGMSSFDGLEKVEACAPVYYNNSDN
jgi:hypothetical protein